MSQTFCSVPFVDIYSDNTNQYKLCCFAGMNDTIEKYNTSNTLPLDFFYSDEMEQIRIDMLEGKRIQGCEVCYNMEGEGKKSFRELKYTYRKTLGEMPLRIKMKLGGSFCNLGCYMCHPINSSTRRNEIRETNTKVFDDFDTDYVSLGKYSYEQIVEHIIENLDEIGEIHLTGGEPFLLPRVWDMLDRISDDDAKRISITCDTNLTTTKYGDRTLRDLLDKFPNFVIYTSADHFGKKLEWIRYPINYKQYEQNLIEYLDRVVLINVTVSMLNIMDLKEIKNYYESKFGIKVSAVYPLTKPSALSIKNIPESDKKIIRERHKFDHILMTELNKPRSEEEYQSALEYCKSLEKNRPIKLIDLFSV